MALVQWVLGTKDLEARSPRSLVRSAGRIWTRNINSCRGWKAWISRASQDQGQGPGQGDRTVCRRSADRCALLQTDTVDRARWDPLVVRPNLITRKTTPNNDVVRLRDRDMAHRAVVIRKKGLALRDEA